MKYKFDTNCIEFTHDEYLYLCSLSCLAPLTPACRSWKMFDTSRGHMFANSLPKLTDKYGNLSVSADFLHDNLFMIRLAHVAVDNSNIKFMHDLMEIILPKHGNIWVALSDPYLDVEHQECCAIDARIHKHNA